MCLAFENRLLLSLASSSLTNTGGVERKGQSSKHGDKLILCMTTAKCVETSNRQDADVLDTLNKM